MNFLLFGGGGGVDMGGPAVMNIRLRSHLITDIRQHNLFPDNGKYWATANEYNLEMFLRTNANRKNF